MHRLRPDQQSAAPPPIHKLSSIRPPSSRAVPLPFARCRHPQSRVLCQRPSILSALCATVSCATVLCATVLCATVLCATVLHRGTPSPPNIIRAKRGFDNWANRQKVLPERAGADATIGCARIFREDSLLIFRRGSTCGCVRSGRQQKWSTRRRAARRASREASVPTCFAMPASASYCRSTASIP